MGFAVNKNETLDRTLQTVLVLLALISIVTGFNLFRKDLTGKSIECAGELRMLQYRKSLYCMVATMIVLPGIFAANGFLITGNYAFPGIDSFLISVLAIFMPRKQNIILLFKILQTQDLRKAGGKVIHATIQRNCIIKDPTLWPDPKRFKIYHSIIFHFDPSFSTVAACGRRFKMVLARCFMPLRFYYGVPDLRI